MFATLLKYEFRRTKNILLPLNLGGLGIGAMGYFVMLLLMKLVQNPDSDFTVISPLLLILWIGLFVMLALLSTAMAIVLCIQFFRDKFTDQGYLTFTLPATTHQILLSSYLNFLLWTIFNTIITVIGLILLVAPFFSNVIRELSQLGLDVSYLWAVIKEELAAYLPSGILFTVGYISVGISGLFYGITLPYLAITLASILVKKMKLLVAVGIGYGMSMVMGIIPSILSMIEGFITGMIMASSNTPSYYIPGSVSLILTAILYMVFAVGGYFLMHKLVKNKLNL